MGGGGLRQGYEIFSQSQRPKIDDDGSLDFTNQSVENACVAFVKGANERNEFFEIINKQLYMTNKPDDQGKGLIISGTN